MPKSNMNLDEIEQELTELGETGNAKVKSGGLYVQREENASWLFVGTVEDESDAKEAVAAYFA